MKFGKSAKAYFMLAAARTAFAFTLHHSKNSFQARKTFLAMSTAVSSTSVSANPFLEQSGLPKFGSIEPKYLEPAVTDLLEELENEFKDMENDLASSEETKYDDVLPVLEKIQNPLEYAWGVAGHLNGVKNGEELRKAYEGQQPKVVKAFSSFSQSKPLFDALSKIEKDLTSTETFEDKQRARAVALSLRAMRLGGVGLEGEAKERFNEIRIRLSELSTKFSNNVLDSTKAWSLTVSSEEASKLDGVPSSAKGMWAQMYAQHAASEYVGEAPKPDAEKGPWRITLDGPSYIAALSHVRDRGIRESVYMASITKASEFEKDADGARDNVPLINEILTLKAEAAKLLGFKNHAERSLAAKMASSVESVTELSDLILEKALPNAYKELEAVTNYARENGGEDYSEEKLEKLMPYDVTFWSERYKEAKFALKEEELRPYFKFEAVLEGMFGLVDRIFGIKCVAADGEAEVWNDDVRFFNVLDSESGKHIASFYLDPYSRPADKRGGAWMDVCIGKSDALGRDIPVAYLTCNGSPPVGDTPSLMTFREVETLFHEFGHGLQHMLTKATVGDVAGINGVEWDAVELPSQFMENWCYDKPTVYGFANHYETGEPLPEEIFEKLKAQKTYNAAMMACRQLYFGQMDMQLHSEYDPNNDKGETIFDVQRRVAEKYSPYNMPLEQDRFLCAFGHIFAGGYSAGYYSYKWAEVMSADAFGAFEDVGLDNDEKVIEVGKKFRDTVLSLGGAVPPSDVFSQFRGREPSPDALLRHNGLD